MDVVQGFKLPPGQCFICSQADPKVWAIDTRTEHPAVVRLFRTYICGNCVVAAAKMLAPFTGVEVIDGALKAELDGQVARSMEWQARAEKAEGRLADLASLAVQD